MKFSGTYDDFIRLVGIRLKAVFAKSEATQSELAAVLNTSQSSLSRILTGKGGLSSELTYQIAKNLDINWNWLILGDPSGLDKNTYTSILEEPFVGYSTKSETELLKQEIENLKIQLHLKDKIIALLENQK